MVRDKISKFIKTSFFLAYLVLLLPLAEVALKFIAPATVTVKAGVVNVAKAAIYGWAMPPSSTGALRDFDTGEIYYQPINSQGWHDVEHHIEKPEGIKRILFIGDSITRGLVPLDDLYTRQVESLLKKRGFLNVEVISMGVAGWSTDQELEALILEGMEYSPDIVIYQFCDNDILENLNPTEKSEPWDLYRLKPFKYILENGYLKKIKLQPVVYKISKIQKLKQFLLKSALIYHADRVKDRAIKYFSEKGKKWWDSYYIDPLDTVYWHDSIGPHEDISRGIDLLEALILRMKQVSEDNGASFMVFAVAGEDGYRIWNMRWKRILAGANSDYVIWQGKKYPVDLSRPLKEIRNICEKHDIPSIAPTRQYSRYVNDPHPNRLGNLAMAEDITDFLIMKKLIPGKHD